MKRIITISLVLVLTLLISFTAILTFIGIETNKFNKIISEKVSQTNIIDLKLKTIRFKINPKEFNLFLETQSPVIAFKEAILPIRNIKVFIDFFQLLKSDLKIKKISLNSDELDLNQINKLSFSIKPSNIKSIPTNKIKKVKLLVEVDIFLDHTSRIKDFIAKGTVNNLESELLNDFKTLKLN